MKRQEIEKRVNSILMEKMKVVSEKDDRRTNMNIKKTPMTTLSNK